jgi:hypothetical protein
MNPVTAVIRIENDKWDGKSVNFMFGEWKGQDRRIGEAGSKEETLRVAKKWLEGWLGPNL